MKISTAIVLAGGKGSRMGADKALLTWRGETLLGRAVRACREAGLARVIVVGRESLAGWDSDDRVRFLPDETPGLGPLGGLATALEDLSGEGEVGDEGALALACDLPLVDGAAVRWLIGEAERAGGGCGGVVAVGDERVQPLFAVYSRALLPLILERLGQGRRSMMGVIEAGQLRMVPAPPEIAAKLVNVNTPGDLAAIDLSLPRG